MRNHRFFFPLLILFLTFLLAGLIVVSTQRRVSNAFEETSISDAIYEKEMRVAVKKFLTKYEDVTEDVERIATTQEALDELLGMRVPVMFKEIHLELVLRLQEIKSALVLKKEPSDAWSRFREVVARSIWLS